MSYDIPFVKLLAAQLRRLGPYLAGLGDYFDSSIVSMAVTFPLVVAHLIRLLLMRFKAEVRSNSNTYNVIQAGLVIQA